MPFAPSSVRSLLVAMPLFLIAMHLFLVAFLLLVVRPGAPSSFLFLVAMPLLLLANIVTTSKAPVTTSVALVTKRIGIRPQCHRHDVTPTDPSILLVSNVHRCATCCTSGCRYGSDPSLRGCILQKTGCFRSHRMFQVSGIHSSCQVWKLKGTTPLGLEGLPQGESLEPNRNGDMQGVPSLRESSIPPRSITGPWMLSHSTKRLYWREDPVLYDPGSGSIPSLPPPKKKEVRKACSSLRLLLASSSYSFNPLFTASPQKDPLSVCKYLEFSSVFVRKTALKLNL